MSSRERDWLNVLHEASREQSQRIWQRRLSDTQMRSILQESASTKTERETMEYLIGLGLALAVCAFAAVSEFDRDLAFYPTMVIVVATYYILFAAMGGSPSAVAVESAVAATFVMAAVAGFKRSLWWVAAALAGHGVFDGFHHLVIDNPGVPVWWPGFCLSFDVLAGGFLSLLLRRRSEFAVKT